MVLGLAHRNVGWDAQTNFFEVMFRMRYWTAHVRSSEKNDSPLPWDDTLGVFLTLG